MSRARIAAILVFIVSLVLAVLIVTDAVPGLRGPALGTGEWYWPYFLRPVSRWWPAVVCAAVLLAFSVWWVCFQPARRWPVAVMVGLALCFQLGFIYADRPSIGAELVDRTLSKDTSGYAAVAGEIEDLDAVLRRFPELMPTFDNEHVRTHPPGFIAAYWLTDHGLRRWPGLAAALAAPVRYWRCTDLWVLARPPSTAAGLLVGSWLPVLAAAFVPLMAWMVARRLYRGPAVAALAASLSAVIPALLVFSPTPDQLYALLGLVSLWLLLKGMDGPRVGLLAVAGAVVSLMTMLSIGNAALAGLLGGFLLVGGYRRQWSHRDWLIGLAGFGVGLSSFWLVYWLGWGVAPWSVVATGLDQHYELVTSQRDYATWLFFNPLDFILLAGLSLVVGWGGLTVVALVRPGWRRSDAGLLAMVLTAILLMLAISGGTRGEVGRLWLVYMPLAAVLAAGGWIAALRSGYTSAQHSSGTRALAPDLVLLVAAQLLPALAIGLAWRPMQAIILPVERPPLDSPGADLQPVDAAFVTPGGPELSLSGYYLTVHEAREREVDVRLAWLAQGPTLEPYTVFVHLVDTQGNLVAQQDNWPVDGRWPTTCWQPDETIADHRQLVVPADAAPGDLRVLVGVYGPDGSRLQTPDGRDSIELGVVAVEP